MKKIFVALSLFSFSALSLLAQKGHEIRINFKNGPDTTMYLARYYFGQSPIVDSCKHIKKGQAVFKGNDKLEKGVYILTNQSKQRYIDFLVDEEQKITLNGEFPELVNTLNSPNSKENNDLFEYARYFTNKNIELQKGLEALKGKSKEDSAKLGSELQKKITADMRAFDTEFMKKHQASFVYSFLNLRNDHYAPDVPLAKNGRPDSVYQYYYYKSHFFDGVDFKDDRILFTPFFKDRIVKYFEKVIVQHPDTVIREIDKLMARCTPGSQLYNTLLAHFTYKYETDKTMSFDSRGETFTFEKVFVHLADAYIISGKAKGLYTDDIVAKIKERVDIIRNLLPGAKVPDLYVIDTADGRRVLKMGFDTSRTSAGAQATYAKHAGEIAPLFKTLYKVNAKYTVLAFWSVDCGHCQKDIPEMNEKLKELKGKVDVKVFAVQTKDELFDKWREFIIEHQLDFINVFEPVHLNNLTQRFDINRTPVIYLLDKDKKIKCKNLTPEQLIDVIKTMESQT